MAVQPHRSILTENDATAARFFERLDSAILMRNASTQFADGGEFGMGAEIGIATGKLHARGPVGAEQLTSFKYLVTGDGTIRTLRSDRRSVDLGGQRRPWRARSSADQGELHLPGIDVWAGEGSVSTSHRRGRSSGAGPAGDGPAGRRASLIDPAAIGQRGFQALQQQEGQPHLAAGKIPMAGPGIGDPPPRVRSVRIDSTSDRAMRWSDWPHQRRCGRSGCAHWHWPRFRRSAHFRPRPAPSIVISSTPLPMAPIGLIRSWQMREAIRAAEVGSCRTW
jgi:hypothetical protein